MIRYIPIAARPKMLGFLYSFNLHFTSVRAYG